MNKCGLRRAGNELESIRLILPSSSPRLCFPLFSLSSCYFRFSFCKIWKPRRPISPFISWPAADGLVFHPGYGDSRDGFRNVWQSPRTGLAGQGPNTKGFPNFGKWKFRETRRKCRKGEGIRGHDQIPWWFTNESSNFELQTWALPPSLLYPVWS